MVTSVVIVGEGGLKEFRAWRSHIANVVCWCWELFKIGGLLGAFIANFARGFLRRGFLRRRLLREFRARVALLGFRLVLAKESSITSIKAGKKAEAEIETWMILLSLATKEFSFGISRKHSSAD